jgi:hypothetical protein
MLLKRKYTIEMRCLEITSTVSTTFALIKECKRGKDYKKYINQCSSVDG